MPESTGIPEEHLRACILEQYHLTIDKLEYVHLGLDYSAAVYRAVSKHATSYLLKTTSRPLYEPTYLIPRYLNEQGIKSVVAPIPTRKGDLWTHLHDSTLVVYPFIDGDSNFHGMTDEQWNKVGGIFKRIHEAEPPTGVTSIRKETFEPKEYSQWVRAFVEEYSLTENATVSEREVYTCWGNHQFLIHTLVTSLERLAEILQARTVQYVICHGDLHPANLIRDDFGYVHVIDWDEVMLAPKERDFIFARPPHDDAFFTAYGSTDIDGQILTYYRLERVIQDLIECVRTVCYRSDLREKSKVDAAQLFQYILADTSFLTELIHSAE